MKNLLFLESVTDFFIQKLSLKPVFDFFGNLFFDGDAYKGAIVFYGLALILLIIIVIIICACASNAKKKKKKAQEAKAQQDLNNKLEEENIQTTEETPVEEVKEEPVTEEAITEETVVEATPAQEPAQEEAPVEEVTASKETHVEEVKEEPVAEETKEETVTENVTTEETPTKEEAFVEPTPIQEPVQEEIPAEEVPVQEEVKEEKPAPKKTSKKSTTKAAPKENKKEVKEKPEVNETQAPTNEQVEDKKQEALGKYAISQEGINWRYRLFASNGQLLLVSELYTSEDSCRKGIDTIKQYSSEDNIDIVKDKHDLFSFRVLTKQGRYLATSANYKTKERAVSASKSFIKFAQSDKIINVEAEDHFEVEEFKGDVTPEQYGKFRFEAVGDEIVFKLYASNGRVIAVSQPYASKKYCLEALEKFRVLAYDGIFYIFKDKNAKYQFKLYNKQKRLVLAGEVYDNKQNAISVITSIKKFAKLAEIVEDKPQEDENK